MFRQNKLDRILIIHNASIIAQHLMQSKKSKTFVSSLIQK
jgi:hypothetical protein